MPGILYLVATPIGNLNDISPRVRSTLDSVDLILAEDTRVTIKLLNHLDIKKRMLSCHDFNEKSRLSLIKQFADSAQKIALVSDAGTPLISDPGSQIVQEAISCDMNIIPIPGPSACLLALIVSGLPCDRFVFEGFLPVKPKLLQERLEKLKNEERTIVLYEAPHRILKTLQALSNQLGDRYISIVRELTKKHEETVRGKISAIINKLSDDTTLGAKAIKKSADANRNNKKILGEYVLVIAGNKTASDLDRISQTELKNAIKQMLKQGKTLKTAVQDITQAYKLKRSEVYTLALGIQKQLNE